MSSARSGDFLDGDPRTGPDGPSDAAVPASPRRASDTLLPAVYDELRAMAQSLLCHEYSGHTLQATALVYEAYLKLAGQTHADWNDRAFLLLRPRPCVAYW